MSRELGHVGRPLAVWALVTAATALAATAASPALQAAGAGSHTFADLLVAGCAAALVVALARLWVITSVTVAQLLTGRARSGSGATRRLVLLACGAAVLAWAAAPVAADSGSTGASALVGLPLPDRAVADGHGGVQQPHPERRSTRGDADPDTHVVRPGESLWTIALAHPGAGSVEERWRAIWSANRHVIGDDPDLILPGQALRLPATTTSQAPSSDGDRR